MASRALDDLHPALRPRVDRWLAECQQAGLAVLVYCTRRSNEEQAQLYAQGRTAPGRIVTYARPGQSAHNYGLALDFVPLLAGRPQWKAPTPEWERAVLLAENCWLECGAKWARLRDWPHVQLPDWKSFVVSEGLQP